MSDDMSAYREVFLSESAEYVQAIIDGLLSLENDPGDLEPVEVVFRGAHSLKGMAAAMGYDKTADLTHRMESLMDTVRKGEQVADADLIDVMLRAVDSVRLLIDAESSGKKPPSTDSIVAELTTRTERAGEVSSDTEAAKDTSPDAEPESCEGSAPARPVSAEEAPIYRVEVFLSDDCVLKSVRAYMVLKRLNYIGNVLETEPPGQDIEDEKFDRSFVVVVQTPAGAERVEDAACHITDVERVEVTQEQPGAAAPDRARPRSAEMAAPKLSDTQTVRVSISHLDTLVNLVGELVTVRSRLATLTQHSGDKRLEETIEDLHRVAGELQHEVMQTRMVPVGNIFNRFPRMVRDLARDLGKQVEFNMTGLEIELDRTVLDEIGDPIVHLLRNAVDHGIGTPEQRLKMDKPEHGAVRLEARRERDRVQIVVADDGRGMDVDAIWAKAVERGMVDPDSRDSVTDEEILLLTCHPGFSTAVEATRVSGRGVGMDVVKGKIEYLGGSLHISSRPGAGSEFVLTLPLTLAIIQALLVRTQEQAFAIPLSAVSEVLSQDETVFDTVDGNPVVVLREGGVAPVYRLDVLAGVGGDSRRLPDSDEHVILLESGDQVRALAVETLVGRAEIVIKPLAQLFKHMKGLGGATVLGDGTVALILDPRSFFTMGEM